MNSGFMEPMWGVVFALGAALLWTVATRLFQGAGRYVPALEMNLAKGLIASCLLAANLPFTLQGRGWPEGSALALLLLSGIIGIGIGDTAYFRALQVLGTRRVLQMELLAAPVAAGFSWVLLGEGLPPLAWLGLALTLAGVALVIREGLAEEPTGPPAAGDSAVSAAILPDPGSGERRIRQAWGWALLAALGQGVGLVLARQAFRTASPDPALASLLRLLAGMAWVLFLWSRSGSGLILLRCRDARLWGRLLVASLLGTWLGLWLQQAALARIPAGMVQTLLCTAPLFAMVLARLSGRRSSLPAMLGALLSLAGVALLTRAF